MEEDNHGAIRKAGAKAVISLITSLIHFFFLYALLRKEKIRQSSYNVYIIFLILPDAFVNLTSHGLFNAFVALNGGKDVFPPGYYYLDVWSWFFYYYANCFLNGVVAYEINNLVLRSYARKRTNPPSLARVYKQVAAVYVLATILALFMVVPYPWALYTITDSLKGKGHLGGEVFDETTAMAIGFGIMLLPMFYVVFIRLRIWWGNLLPKRGRTRALSLFFMRILVVFLIFYLPNTVLVALLPEVPDPDAKYWISIMMGFFTAGQGLINLSLLYLKDDISEAVKEAWNLTFGRCCCACKGGGERRQGVASQVSVQISGLSAPIRSNSVDGSLDISIQNQPPLESLPDAKSIWEEPDVYDSGPETLDAVRSYDDDLAVDSAEQDGHETTPPLDDMESNLEVSGRHSRVDMSGSRIDGPE
ncbi:MAG: hypothetical protein SGBAC_004298 [Bacillariaceae sp.]